QEPVKSAGAEYAAHAAADLGADASGTPIAFLDKDALHELFVLQAEKQLVRTVFRLLVALDASDQRHERRRQSLAKILRQVGHLFERLGPVGKNPAANLPGAHPRLAAALKPGQQLGMRNVD